MRVGVLINSIEVFGGIGKIAVEEVKNLRKLGVDAELVVYMDAGKINKYEEISEDIPIVRLAEFLPPELRINRRIPIFTIFNFGHLAFPFLLPKYVKGRWDVVVNHESYLTFLLLRLGVPYIQVVWDPVEYIMRRVYNFGWLKYINWLLRFLGKQLDILFLTRAKYVFLGGSAHVDFMNELGVEYGFLYPSVYPLDNIGAPKEDFVFMITGWKNGKNPEYLFELLSACPELKIKMGGLWLDQNYREKFEAEVGKKGFSDRLEVLGSLSEKKLVGYLKTARVVLQTNDDRGFGMPALEAAGCGCSFIIPKGQGVCDLFENGVEGFFTTECDTDTIVDLLRRFLEDESFAVEMGRKAWEKVKSSYSWKAHCEGILDIIEGF